MTLHWPPLSVLFNGNEKWGHLKLTGIILTIVRLSPTRNLLLKWNKIQFLDLTLAYKYKSYVSVVCIFPNMLMATALLLKASSVRPWNGWRDEIVWNGEKEATKKEEILSRKPRYKLYSWNCCYYKAILSIQGLQGNVRKRERSWSCLVKSVQK